MTGPCAVCCFVLGAAAGAAVTFLVLLLSDETPAYRPYDGARAEGPPLPGPGGATPQRPSEREPWLPGGMGGSTYTPGR